MKFDYLYFETYFLPVVSFRIKGKTEWVEFVAFVDTGASYSLFKPDVADILGIKMEEGEQREVIIGDGDKLQVYLHRVLFFIAGQEFTATIGFSHGLGTGFNILGRKDIFERFLVTFNEKEKWIEFKANP